MSLINCRECGKQISDKSIVCVHCGAPAKSRLTENGDRTNRKRALRYLAEYTAGWKLLVVWLITMVLVFIWAQRIEGNLLLSIILATWFGYLAQIVYLWWERRRLDRELSDEDFAKLWLLVGGLDSYKREQLVIATIEPANEEPEIIEGLITSLNKIGFQSKSDVDEEKFVNFPKYTYVKEVKAEHAREKVDEAFDEISQIVRMNHGARVFVSVGSNWAWRTGTVEQHDT